MPDILKPEKNSRENILNFINTIPNDDIKNLLLSNIEHILNVGANPNENKDHRQAFLQAVENLINEKS